MFASHYKHFEEVIKAKFGFKVKILNIIDFYIINKEQSLRPIYQFDCNNRSMNQYLHEQAIEDALSMWEEGCTTVIIDEGNRVLAYYTIVPSDITFSDDDTCKCLLISRLATSKYIQGMGLGSILIEDIFNIAKSVGYRFITLDALPSKVEWYMGKKFIPFEEIDFSSNKFIEQTSEIIEDELVYMYHDLIDRDSIREFYLD